MNKIYLDFNTYLKNKFKHKVYKVVVDAGFSCPNRDGSLSSNGCIYCNEQGSGSGLSHLSIKEQILKGIDSIKNKNPDAKIMVYFQAFSNTYGSLEKLEKVYSQALCHKDIVAFAIGTRPDCVDVEKLELIDKIFKGYEVWMEYGLQSANNQTLKTINRHHNFEQFLLALVRTKKFPDLKICVHVIFGLPDETKLDMLNTIQRIAPLEIDGIKFHPLYVEKGTTLEKTFKEKPFTLLSQQEYIELLACALEMLPKNVVIQRLTADCPREQLIAPLWISNKLQVLNDLSKYMIEQESFQGKRM